METIKERVKAQSSLNKTSYETKATAEKRAKTEATNYYIEYKDKILLGYLDFAMRVFESGWRGHVSIDTNSTLFPLAIKLDNPIQRNFDMINGKCHIHKIPNLPFGKVNDMMHDLKQAFIDAGFAVTGGYNFLVKLPE